MNKVIIDGVPIGSDYPPYIVAEMSANHNGQIERALATITEAKKRGAQAVKLQTYTADTMTINSRLPDFQIESGLWQGYNLYELYKEAETPYSWHEALFEHAKKEQITCFSTPFDETAVDVLEGLNAPAYKIASFEAIDIPLIQYVARTKKPMIISTGMADLIEIEEAVDAARANGCEDLILLHCISSYPAPASQSNLATIKDLEKRFKVVVGLSDHTLGTTVSVASVALGASFIEKHFMLDRTIKGPDSDFSLEPNELERLCFDCQVAWSAIGVAGYERKAAESENLKFRRSLYFVKRLKKGDIITADSVRRIRPGFGISPKYYDHVVGKTLKKDVDVGAPVAWECVDN